jgi:hypothetical protein
MKTHIQIRLERLTPEYWRVTLDNSPFNLFGRQAVRYIMAPEKLRESECRKNYCSSRPTSPPRPMRHR